MTQEQQRLIVDMFWEISHTCEGGDIQELYREDVTRLFPELTDLIQRPVYTPPPEGERSYSALFDIDKAMKDIWTPHVLNDLFTASPLLELLKK